MSGCVMFHAPNHDLPLHLCPLPTSKFQFQLNSCLVFRITSRDMISIDWDQSESHRGVTQKMTFFGWEELECWNRIRSQQVPDPWTLPGTVS